MPRVLNMHRDAIPADAVFVGRPSKYGNPFHVKQYGRAKAVEFYRQWLIDVLADDPSFLKPLRGYDLVCYCAPLACHADVLLEFANVDESL